jgi:signal transduction histidine kinase
MVGFIGSSSDITEIYESRQALKELDQRKDEFLAMLAHELRNPLAPICSGLEILKLTRNDSDAAMNVRSMMEQTGLKLRHLHSGIRMAER